MAHDTPSGSDEFIDADKRDILAAAKFIPTEPSDSLEGTVAFRRQVNRGLVSH